MADNETTGTGKAVATDKVTYSGDAAQNIQLVRIVQVTGAEDAKTVVDLPGDATNGLDVDVIRLPALVAGTANIGDVDVLTLPALVAGTANIGDVDVLTVPADPFGVNADAASATGSISAKLRFISATGIPVTALPALVAGTANIGDVDVLTLPALVAGTANIGDVDVLTLPAVAGAAAQDAAISGNPVPAGWRASTAIPTAMSADGDVVYPWANRSGAPVVAVAPHVGLNSDPWNLVHEAAQYTTTQTSTVLVAGGASEKIVVTKVQIQVGGTTAGTAQLYFGTGAFARGTNRTIFDGEFAPSATLKPGVIMDGPFIAGTNGDDLMVTTSAAINPITINVWYYVVT